LSSNFYHVFQKFYIKNLDQITSTPNNSPVQNQDTTVLMLRLRKLLEEEKSKGDSLRNEIDWLKRKSNTSITEDSIKISELEVENEKLRQDYQLLRNSIKRGVEHQELEAQYQSLIEELKRRRDECIQLRTILSQQSQTIRSFAAQPDSKDSSYKNYDAIELMEAFQAQKLANKQLESELTALTEEHNMKLLEMMKELDTLRHEKYMLETIMNDKVEMENGYDAVTMRQKESYLRLELEKAAAGYVESQESLNTVKKQLQDLQKRNNILAMRLKDNGLSDSILSTESGFGAGMAGVMKKKAQSFQGILKHQHSDESKILQRLVNDLTPRTAITLLPSLPAYILFMCIRYTDLLNADNQVKTLLSGYIIAVRKMSKNPNKLETRILWIVNSITLHNLLKQYGGNEEYMQYNTELQNQQQLKNFDLSEYRAVIHEAIVFIYEAIIRQLQDSLKSLIVPAILHHDETARGKNRKTMGSPGSVDKMITEPQSLINQLEHFYKQCVFFGLNECYIEQIFQQLFYYICAIALNNLMLRRDICTWKTGMKLKFNLSCLETWVKRQKMVNNNFFKFKLLLKNIFFYYSQKQFFRHRHL
jgi:myosin V